MTSSTPKREIIFEFHRLGSYVKVVAMDVTTQEEVSITGTLTATKEYLKKIAYDKLMMVLRQKGLIK
jgi:hypothetical protein